MKWEDEARFIKTWLERPRTVGAVSPSSRALSRAMAREVDPHVAGPVIELGPGTGPVTDALIRRGIAPERLVLVEYDAAFCRLLSRRYPACKVIQGDAYGLGRTLRGVLDQPAAAVVSSLPLLNRPDQERLSLLSDAFALMHAEAPFVQFTYGLVSPVPRQHLPTGVNGKGSAPVWLNLPPARVWVYRAGEAAETEEAEPRHADGLDLLLDKLKAQGGKIGEEWREHRDRLRAELQARSSECRADIKARAARVKLGIERHKARVVAERVERSAHRRRGNRYDSPHGW